MLRCTMCGLDKSAEDFYRRTKSPTGRQRYCKVCWGPYVKSTQQAWERKHSRLRIKLATGVYVRPRVPRSFTGRPHHSQEKS